MPSESGDRRPARLQHGGAQPPEAEHLPCPRCDSTNTKFCYYNNYNLSQPRHFCKACRRYWTRGGTLRNVPVGGGTRRNPNKRSRATTLPSSSSSSSTLTCDPILGRPISMPPGIKTEMTSPQGTDANLNENLSGTESFSSLLNPPGTGFFAFGGYGLGLGSGSGFREIGFGLGAGVWAMEEVGGGGSVSAAPSCNTWQAGSVEGGLSDGDCFGWPDLAISTPGKGLQ